MILVPLLKIIWPYMRKLFLGSLFCFMVCMSFFMLVPYYFNCYSFVAHFEIRKCDTFNFVVLFPDCFDYSGFLEILYEFEERFFYFCQSTTEIWIGIALNLWVTLGGMNILAVLRLPNYKYRVSFHWFVYQTLHFLSDILLLVNTFILCL